MDKNLLDEISSEIDLLVKTGFYKDFEIVELIDDEFIEFDLDISEIEKLVNLSYINQFSTSSSDFLHLQNAFKKLNTLKIFTIQNGGYDYKEGIQDSFEVYTHLINNKFEVEGFCLYSFLDIEDALKNKQLPLSFGDFEKSKDKSSKIAKIIIKTLEEEGFKVHWNGDVNKQIIIKPFLFEKAIDDELYEMEGAYDLFVSLNK